MKAYIVDTSVVFKFLSLESGRERALELFKLAEERKFKLLAPSLI